MAATLAITIAVRPGAGERSALADSRAGDPTHRTAVSAFSRAFGGAGDDAGDARHGSLGRPAAGRSIERDYYTVQLPELGTGAVSAERQQLVARAAQVEREARDRLERLTEDLDLTASQQRRIFPALARASAAWDPAMIVGTGSDATLADLSPEEEIHQQLDPEQQALYEEALLDDLLWWQEIISQLEQNLNEATGGGTVEPADPGAAVPGIPVRESPDGAPATDVDPGAGGSLFGE